MKYKLGLNSLVIVINVGIVIVCLIVFVNLTVLFECWRVINNTEHDIDDSSDMGVF